MEEWTLALAAVTVVLTGVTTILLIVTERRWHVYRPKGQLTVEMTEVVTDERNVRWGKLIVANAGDATLSGMRTWWYGVRFKPTVKVGTSFDLAVPKVMASGDRVTILVQATEPGASWMQWCASSGTSIVAGWEPLQEQGTVAEIRGDQAVSVFDAHSIRWKPWKWRRGRRPLWGLSGRPVGPFPNGVAARSLRGASASQEAVDQLIGAGLTPIEAASADLTRD